MIGSRVHLEYFDQNETFARQLPREGTVLRRVTSRDGADDWFLIELGKSVEWDGRAYHHVLVRSRWMGYPLGGPEPTSVFLLLVADPQVVGADPVALEQFPHIAWALASTGGGITNRST